jgi:predicted acylesterase/phospholipase RssA
MNGSRTSNTAIVLSGGASYGAYEVGVMLALFQGDSPVTGGRPLDASQFAGTSIGAFNAAAMVAGAGTSLTDSARRLSRIWLEEIARPPGGCDNGMFRVRGADALGIECLLRPSAVGHAIRDMGFLLGAIVPAAVRFAQVARPLTADSLTRAVLEQLDVSGLFDLTPYRELLKRTVPLDSLLLNGLALRVIASNFDSGTVSVFTEEDIANRVGHDAIIASSSLPGIFVPIKVDGALNVDGGALMNTPLMPAVQGGSDTLHVVYMDPLIENISVENLRSTLGVIDRMIVATFAFAMNQEIDMIHDLNRSFELIDSFDHTQVMDPQINAIARAGKAAAQWARANGEFVPTTIHRHHPAADLGGALGFLDLSYDHVAGLIDRGYRDAVAHDCVASGCVIPGAGTFLERGGLP